eukprot:scaffold2075_cov444-Prasinococcus_capsulatus_cf.AAC.2
MATLCFKLETSCRTATEDHTRPLTPQKERTETLPGLDGVWEKVFEFNVQDGDGDKMKGTFFMDEEQNGGLQIGDTQEFLLDKLVKGKQTYKAIIVPGGKVDLMVTAVDFGAEEKVSLLAGLPLRKCDADEGDGLDFLDDADGGMMMDDDDEVSSSHRFRGSVLVKTAVHARD